MHRSCWLILWLVSSATIVAAETDTVLSSAPVNAEEKLASLKLERERLLQQLQQLESAIEVDLTPVSAQ